MQINRVPLYTLLLIVSLLVPLTVFAQEKQPASQALYLEIPAPSLANSMIGERTEQGIAVYLPPSYHSSDKRYPVLYFLPGYGDKYNNYMKNVFAPYMDKLLAQSAVHEMIIVTVNGIGVLQGTFYANSPVTGNWEDFVTKDVIQYVDANYRTVKEARGRGIAGHSMGGFGAINAVMNTSDIFGYAYALSPGLFDKDGLTQSLVNFELLEKYIRENVHLNKEAAREAYLEYIKKQNWTVTFSFSYAATFAYDINAQAPYIAVPQKESNGTYLHDATWLRYEAGFGGISKKLETCSANLINLQGLVIEYGIRDKYTFIPAGCRFFSEELAKKGVPHALVSYDGDHVAQLNSRIANELLPYFSKAFSTREVHAHE